jgi:hypothetical protein
MRAFQDLIPSDFFQGFKAAAITCLISLHFLSLEFLLSLKSFSRHVLRHEKTLLLEAFIVFALISWIYKR